MSQEIINKCDLCKEIIPHEETIWTVGVLTSQRKQGGKQLRPHGCGLPVGPGSAESNPGKSLECCRKCMTERYQLIPQLEEDKNTLPAPPSLEDLIYEIASEATADYQN